MIYLVRVWAAPGVNHQNVENVLNGELDWIRFDTMTWMVESARPANVVAQRLRYVIGNTYHLVIEVNQNNAQGWMTENVWAWLNARP